MKMLRNVLPYEIFRSNLTKELNSRLDVEVVTEFYGPTFQPWPGPQKNVACWWELKDGSAVAWNENPARGWSFPVIAKFVKPGTDLQKDAIRRELLGQLDNLWLNKGPHALHRFIEAEMLRIDKEQPNLDHSKSMKLVDEFEKV